MSLTTRFSTVFAELIKAKTKPEVTFSTIDDTISVESTNESIENFIRQLASNKITTITMITSDEIILITEDFTERYNSQPVEEVICEVLEV